MQVKAKLLSSLAKVFADEEPFEALAETKFQGFLNETISFQVAYGLAGTVNNDLAQVVIESPIAGFLRVRRVDLVPVGFSAFLDSDDNYLRKTPGLYPDLLSDLPGGVVRLFAGQWRSLWVDIEPGGVLQAGTYPVSIAFRSFSGEEWARCGAVAVILGASLPPQKLRHSQWFHADCLAEYYHTDVFSRRHWELMENYVGHAVKRGINTILTPLFTPPLDTAVGGERLTTQLVDVSAMDGAYSFGFAKLDQWIDMCLRCGVEYFEIAHLFTQWGAAHAPKIMAHVEGEYRRIFGWETEAASEAYRTFLSAFLPLLVRHLDRRGISGKCFFHISDEPSHEHLGSYVAAKSTVSPYLRGFDIVDALSDVKFYLSGAVEKPIPSNDHIQPFLDAGVPSLWTYYCVGQYKDVCNQFISMPSARNRMIGVQLYKFGIEGLLHWGYNFYHTQNSIGQVNPYLITDADGFVPSGDAFVVYPGSDGMPQDSLRLMVTAQAMYDVRAFRLLESLAGREHVMNLIESGLKEPVTFLRYPAQNEYLLELRRKIDDEIMQRLGLSNL